MKAHQAKQTFENVIAHAGLILEQLTVEHGLTLMLDFYGGYRPQDCDDEHDGDMLLYQWGTYDWGSGSNFEFDLTRQFINHDAEDENIWQLSLTFKYQPSDDLAKLGSGNCWCTEPTAPAVVSFKQFVRESEAYATLIRHQTETVELDYFNAG